MEPSGCLDRLVTARNDTVFGAMAGPATASAGASRSARQDRTGPLVHGGDRDVSAVTERDRTEAILKSRSATLQISAGHGTEVRLGIDAGIRSCTPNAGLPIIRRRPMIKAIIQSALLTIIIACAGCAAKPNADGTPVKARIPASGGYDAN